MVEGRISLNLVFLLAARTVAASLGDFGLTYDRVRVVVRNNPDTSKVVVDTTVAFGPSSNSLTLNITVPIAIKGQVFNTRVEYAGNAGVLYGGKVLVKSYRPGEAAPEQPPLLLNFEGPGARLKTLTVAPDPVQLVGAATSQVTITAVDSSGATIAVPPLLFSTSDASVAVLGTTASNRAVQSFGKRGSAILTATAPNGISDTLSAVVTLPPTGITLVNGGGQSGTVGAPLSAPAVVQVNANDGAGVAGVAVTFAAPIGGSVSPAQATTDANGRASTTMTLATGTGPQSFVATAAGFNVAIPATASADAASPATSTITPSVATIRADNATPTTITLQAKDQYGNTIDGGGATVNLSTTLGLFGSIGGVTTTDATYIGNGRYSAQLFSARAGTATITATIGDRAVANQATVAVSAIPVASIALFTGQNQQGDAGAQLEAPGVVQVKSAEGVGIPDVAVTFTSLNGGSVGTATATTDANGLASTTLKLGPVAGAQAFRATAATFSIDIPATANVGPASAATSTISSSVAQINADNSSSAIVTVRTKDQYGNVIATGGANVTVTTTVGHWASGSATSSATDQNDGSYTATLSSAQSGTATITAKIGNVALTAPPLTITVLALPLHHFDVTRADGSPIGSVGAGVATQVRITARDQLGNVVTGYTGQPTLTSSSNTTLIGGSPVVATQAVNGISTAIVKFGTLATGVTLDAAGDGKSGQSAPFNVVPGPAASIVSTNTSGTTIKYDMGSSPSEYPAIKVRDGVSNPVPNQTVSLSKSGPCTVTSQLTTDAAGAIALSSSSLTVPSQSATTPFSCDIAFSIPGVTPLHFALLVQPSNSTVWTGHTSDAWELSDNWTSSVPSTTVSPFIPAAQASNPIAYPVLHGGASISSIDVEDGARVNLNNNTLSIYQNIDARTSGAIVGGTIAVPIGANGGTVRGSLPNVNCQSGQHTLNGPTQLTGTLTLGNCTFDLGAQTLAVAGALTTTAGGGFIMNQTNSVLTAGAVSFGGTGSQLSAGTLNVLGNFTQTGTGTFAPTIGTHTVALGPSTQDQSVTYGDLTSSWFQNLDVSVASGRTVSINSAVQVRGNLTIHGTGGTFALPAGLTALNGPMVATGTMTLAIGGVVNATSLTLGNGTITVTGSGLVVLGSGTLRLDDNLHLIVNIPGDIMGNITTTCTHGSNVTIDGNNTQAIGALRQLCGIAP